MREFEQMEMQFFVKPGTELEWFETWKKTRMAWHQALGFGAENYRFHDHEKLAHYANAASDIEFKMPFGFKEVEGIHSRTNFDLSQHAKFSGKKIEYFDPETNESYTPYVIETSIGVDRMFLTIMSHSYQEEKLENGETRVVLKLPAALAPVKLAVMPLVKKDGLPEKAHEIINELRFHFNCKYDEKDSIGKRYRRQDAVGTPFCVTVDYDTLKEKYPRLVMAHATGYGCKDGPLSAAPGLDAVAFFAMNGLISDLRLNPDDSPICPPTGMGDLTTGMPLFGAIMTALFARERTGKGDYVSASLYGTGNWVTSAINSGTQYFNPWPRSRFTQSPMGQAFETKDGKFVQIFVNEYERYFPVFCKAFNIEDMLDDERVNTRPALNVNGNCAIIVARCIEEAKKKTADEIMSVLQAGNVPCTVLRGIGDKYKEQEQLDQCLSNGYLGEGTYESGKHYYQPQIPIYMESVGVQNYFAQSKSIGADNDALFAEFSK